MGNMDLEDGLKQGKKRSDITNEGLVPSWEKRKLSTNHMVQNSGQIWLFLHDLWSM